MRRLMRAGVTALMTIMMGACSVIGGKAAEEPPYEVLVEEPPFEIREYAPMVVARTRVEGTEYRSAVREGFGRLFDYITGANAGASEIAMTAPVLTEPDAPKTGDEIAMTAPVLQEEAPGGWDITFVLPADMTAETAPRPTDARVQIEAVPARRVAVARFSGFLSADAIAENRAALEAWLEDRPETPAGAWQAAGYNPPWTIPFLRRNEIQMVLD